jgi:hypothetical protein
VGDDFGVVFDDVAIAIDYSGCKLAGHCIPPNKNRDRMIALRLIQSRVARQGIDIIEIGALAVLVASFERLHRNLEL